MGSCLSARIKAESPPHNGAFSTRKDEKGVSKSSSRLSSVFRTEGEILQSSNLKSFSYNELKTATRNFRPDSVLGEGGFGCVFKGWIDEHTFAATRPGTGLVIAAKRLNKEGYQGHQEWLREINFLGQLWHPNLVKLIGYCLEDDQRLLVYEFMAKGSLENHLFRRGAYFLPLSWNIRMKVSLGAAKGLAFLHSDQAKVIHRDFKTSNILLDSNYGAKLSDFGLAKDGPTGDQSHVSTRVMGTKGYAAPEYMATGHLTPKSDVYSFGVVLLEVLCGRRAIDNNKPTKEQNLIEWAKPYLKSRRRMLQIMDARIEGQYTPSAAIKATTLAVKCISLEPTHRPNMNEVVKTLEELQDSSDLGSPQEKVELYSSNGGRNQRMSLNDNSNQKLNKGRPRPSPLASPLRKETKE